MYVASGVVAPHIIIPGTRWRAFCFTPWPI